MWTHFNWPPDHGGSDPTIKLFLIDAVFDGSAGHRRLVFTGSHNWAARSSYGNDELLARLEGDEQYDAFYRHSARRER